MHSVHINAYGHMCIPGLLHTQSGCSGSEVVGLPFEWHQLLGQVRYAEAVALTAALEPLSVNRRLVSRSAHSVRSSSSSCY